MHKFVNNAHMHYSVRDSGDKLSYQQLTTLQFVKQATHHRTFRQRARQHARQQTTPLEN